MFHLNAMTPAKAKGSIDCRRKSPWSLIARIATLAVSVGVVFFVQTGYAEPPRAESSDRPNIVFILADDLGIGDVGCYGGKVPTPHIDSLAGEGTRFTSGYCSAATCTPTR